MLLEKVLNRKIYLILIFFLPLRLFTATFSQARLTAVVFKGRFSLKQKVLEKQLGLGAGLTMNQKKIEQAAKQLQKNLIDRGFLFCRLDSLKTIFTDSKKQTVRLIIFGDNGPLVRIGKIRIIADSLTSEEYAQRLIIARGDPYSETALQKSIGALLARAAEHGFPFATARISNPHVLQAHGRHPKVDVQIVVHEGPKVFIKDILLEGNVYTHDNVILRELGLRKNAPFSKTAVDNIPRRLQRLNIFKNVQPPRLLKAAADSVYLLIKVTEGNATRFDGMLGYIPQAAKQKGYFTGLLDINFGNLFGTGRRFNVHWKKADRNSEEFNMAYTEPWILGYPLDAGMGLERIVRDTAYIEWKTHLNLRFRLSDNFSLIGNINRSTVFPDSTASQRLRLARNEIINGEIGVVYDTRDYFLNPRSGLYYKSTYSYGRKKNLGPVYLFREDSLAKKEELQTIKVELDGYYHLWANQVLALELHLQQIKGPHLQLSDYFWFGGSRSLRGYRENSFYGTIVAWSRLEYRFLMSRNARLFLFNDWGYYQYPQKKSLKNELLPGYGLGVRFETPLGILGVDYGLGKGDSFSQGKIHFGLFNTF